MKSLNIKTGDSVNTNDKLHTYKQWFNGIKHFFTVKVSPPKQDPYKGLYKGDAHPILPDIPEPKK